MPVIWPVAAAYFSALVQHLCEHLTSLNGGRPSRSRLASSAVHERVFDEPLVPRTIFLTAAESPVNWSCNRRCRKP